MKFYEIATLDTVIFGGGKAAPAIEAWVKAPEAKGTLLGAFGTDIGTLNRVLLLRGFDTLEDLTGERERALRSSNPFGCGELLTGRLREPSVTISSGGREWRVPVSHFIAFQKKATASEPDA